MYVGGMRSSFGAILELKRMGLGRWWCVIEPYLGALGVAVARWDTRQVMIHFVSVP